MIYLLQCFASLRCNFMTLYIMNTLQLWSPFKKMKSTRCLIEPKAKKTYTTVHQFEENVDYEHWSLLLHLSSIFSSLQISIRFKLIHSFFLLIFSLHKTHLTISTSHFSILEFLVFISLSTCLKLVFSFFLFTASLHTILFLLFTSPSQFSFQSGLTLLIIFLVHLFSTECSSSYPLICLISLLSSSILFSLF